MKDTQPTVLHAGCKVNLYLEILGQREDGYHDLYSLFFPLPYPHDILSIVPGRKASGLTLSCSCRELENDSNIVQKAYRSFGQRTGYTPDLELFLDKRIPMGAGLGGGSSDAATLLSFLNIQAEGRGLTREQLQSLAAEIGADVPFFLDPAPAVATGIGEILHRISFSPQGWTMILACPDIHVSTAEAYRAWDRRDRPGQPSLTRPYAEDKKPLCFCDFVLYNSFEQAVFPLYPYIRTLKLAMLEFGASGCVMSGSGSSLSVFFKNDSDSGKACSWLEAEGIIYYRLQF